MFFALRTIYADPGLEKGLRERLVGHFKDEKMFLTRSAANVNRFKPPLGLMGGIKTEHDEEHRGQIDIKKAGIFAITEGVKALAMEAGVMSGGTRERIEMLVEKKVLSQKLADDLFDQFPGVDPVQLVCLVKILVHGGETQNPLLQPLKHAPCILGLRPADLHVHDRGDEAALDGCGGVTHYRCERLRLVFVEPRSPRSHGSLYSDSTDVRSPRRMPQT